ncbi:MAG: HD domain-containing protein [Deltaproteobacteria bacterium]|nr:HD domain-containing protein [Deltaproteobacteria bacterium]
MDIKDRITELETELFRLKQELEKAKELEKGHEDARSAMLYMLEDLNESMASILLAKKEWEGAFDAILDPIFIHDREFRLVKANRAYAGAAGMPFKNLIGKPYYEVFPKMDGPFEMCKRAQELREEEEEEVSGKIFKVRYYPVRGANGKILYSIHVMEDITEARKAEERIKQEMEITSHLLMIAEATAHTTDIDKLMQQVMRCGHEIMKCDVCLSYLWDDGTRKFAPCKEYGLSHDLIPVFMTEPLGEEAEFVKEALEKGEPLTLPSPQRGEGTPYNSPPLTGGEKGEGESQFSWLPDAKTITAIPLLGREEPLGIIFGIYKKEVEITERDRKVMHGISYQVSIALEEARLYRESVDSAMELSHKVETIQVMHEIDRSILSTLEFHEILEIAARMILKVMSCDRTTISIVDKERQGFIYQAGFGTAIVPKGAFVPFRETNATEVVKTGKPQYAANLIEAKGLPSLERNLCKEGFISHIRVPIMVKGEVEGLLSVGAKRPSGFTKENLATLEKIASQIGVALENARLVADLDELFVSTVKALSSAIDAKSPWTAGHSERVTNYALAIAKKMGFDEMALKEIELAGHLHDIGKIGTYESILDKPDKLTEEEIKLIKQHPAKGAEILAAIKQLKDIIPGVKYHHEFYDGTGYPDGLKGEAIPIYARILAVADAVDAMEAERPYRKGKTMDAVVLELKRCSGTQFDPQAVNAFLRTLG